VDDAPSLGLAESVSAGPAVGVPGPGDERSLRGRAAALLFPPAPARTGARWRSILFSVVFVTAGATASLLRQSGTSAINSIWAEDGRVFYQSVFRQSYIGALFTPDNGYLDLVPRLLIGVLGHVPVAYAAETFAVTGAIVSSLIALAVYYASAGHIPSRALRLCIAIPTAVVIYGQEEVGNSIVNTQWYLNFACFWMLLWVPRAVWGRLVAAVLLCAAIGSDPMAVAFLPLLVVRLWARPWRESLWQTAGVLLGGAYQAVGILSGSMATRTGTTNYSPRVAETLYRKEILARSLVSPHELSFVGIVGMPKVEILGLAVLVVIGALGAWLARPRWLMAGVCLLFSFGFASACFMQGGGFDPRYCTAPVLLLIAAAAFLVVPPTRRAAEPATDSMDSEGPGGTGGIGGRASGAVPSAADDASGYRSGFGRAAWWGKASLVPATVLCVVVGLNFVASYSGGSLKRGASASWSSQVHAGFEACMHDGVHDAILEIAPGGPRPWKVDVPCSALLGN
jgi:hypothetical protein